MVQGFGLTENGTKGALKTFHVTLRENSFCAEQLKFNITNEKLVSSMRVYSA